jgi:hypothetical protein
MPVTPIQTRIRIRLAASPIEVDCQAFIDRSQYGAALDLIVRQFAIADFISN